MHWAQSRPQLQGSSPGLFSQHPVPNGLAEHGCSRLLCTPPGSLGTAAFALAANDFLLAPHTKIYSANNPLQSVLFFFSSVAKHSAGLGRICTAGSRAVGLHFSLSPPPFFFPLIFPDTFFFGTLTFQLQAKQPLLFFSLFSRITSSETSWHFKSKSVYLCYLYKAPPLTPGFLLGLKSRLPRVRWYPPPAPTSSLCFVA